MFRSMFVRNHILNSGLKKSIRSSIKRCLCTELTKSKVSRVLNAQNRRIYAKPQCIIQVRSYADLPKHTKVNLPALSPTMEKGSIMSWSKKEGDKLSEGDLLCEIQTDKAAMGFEAPEEGYLAKIILPAGSKDVPIGRPLCIIVEEQAHVAAFKDFKDDSRTGSGLYGSLKSTDLSAAGVAEPAAPAATTAPKAVTGPVPGASYVDIPLTNMRAIIAQRLTAAKQTIPHYQLTATVNIEKTLAMRTRMNKKLAAEKADVKLSVNDFIIKAVAAASKRVPEVNAHWMETFIRQYKNVDVSVAVATPTGLITPILFNCDSRGIIDLSKNIKELAAKAKEGKLQPHEFMGGTVSVSNLGMYGITMFNAIINPPQSLILACGGFQEIVIPDKDSEDKNSKRFRIARFVTFTASANHRVIDGALGAMWMKAFKENIEDPANIIL